MKIHAIPALALTLFAVSCSDAPEQSPQYQQLSEDTERLERQVAEKDSTINALFGAFNRISDNLRTIRAKQGQLAQSDGVERDEEVQDRIIGDLQEIDGLLAENRTLIDRMRQQSKKNAANVAELERTLTELERSTSEKDQEIEAIKEQLASTNSSLATLIEMYRDKAMLADMQRDELNAAWFTVGSAKELRDNGVLTKEGGFVGIGKVDKLNTGSLTTDHFTPIDILRTQEIKLLAKKARLVTTHPDGSYRLENGADRLVITDAERFWSVSKYLVVVVE